VAAARGIPPGPSFRAPSFLGLAIERVSLAGIMI